MPIINAGILIHNRRIALGLTLEEIGEACGVSKTTVHKWETGYIQNMRRDKIAALANILQIPPYELINVHDDPESFTEQELQLLHRFRKLSEDGKSYILQQFDAAEVLFPAKPADLQKEG